MKSMNFVLTTVGMYAIYKIGELVGALEATNAINDELKKNHGRKVDGIYLHRRVKRKNEAKVIKVEEEAE